MRYMEGSDSLRKERAKMKLSSGPQVINVYTTYRNYVDIMRKETKKPADSFPPPNVIVVVSCQDARMPSHSESVRVPPLGAFAKRL